MWPDTAVARLLNIAVPIILAPMAGEASTPALAAAVSEAGGLGSLGVAYSAPAAIVEMIRAVKALTSRPFGINLFAPTRAAPASPEQLAEAEAALAPWRARYRLKAEPVDPSRLKMPDFDQQLDAIIAEKPALFSFAFGTIPPATIAALKAAGIVVVGTATTVAEAERLAADGVDAIAAQGSEAGAHRGGFLGVFGGGPQHAPEGGLVGLMALVPAIVDRVKLPVIAAGGIMDGRGIAAAMILGASAVQMGTAFLATPESGASQPWRDALLSSRAGETRLTRAFSGRAARGIPNRFMGEIGAHESALPAFPALNTLTRPIRAAATGQGDPEALSLWAGQGAPLIRPMPAGDLVRTLVDETRRVFDSVGVGSMSRRGGDRA